MFSFIYIVSTTNRWFTLCTTPCKGRIRIQQQHKVASLFLKMRLWCSFLFHSARRLRFSSQQAFLSQRATRCCVRDGRGNREHRAKSATRGILHTFAAAEERFFKLIYRLMVVCLMSAFVSWWPPLNQIFTTPCQRRSRREIWRLFRAH